MMETTGCCDRMEVTDFRRLEMAMGCFEKTSRCLASDWYQLMVSTRWWMISAMLKTAAGPEFEPNGSHSGWLLALLVEGHPCLNLRIAKLGLKILLGNISCFYLTSANVNPTQTEISQFNMTFVRQKHVIRLHIAMNNSMPTYARNQPQHRLDNSHD